jgi:serine/threonine-protein kinase
LSISPDDLGAYTLLSNIELLDSGNAAAALGILDSIPAHVPNRASVDARHVPLLLMQRDYVAARKIVAGLHGENETAKIAITRLQADIEYAAGGTEKAKPYLLALDAWSRRSQGNPDMGSKPDFHSDWALVLAKLGRKDEALQQMDSTMHLLPGIGIPSRSFYRLAVVQLTVGEHEASIATLQKVMAMPDHPFVLSPAMLRADPLWDPLRQDPRFQALMLAQTGAQSTPVAGAAGR